MNGIVYMDVKQTDFFTKIPQLQFDAVSKPCSLQGGNSAIDFTEALLLNSIHRPIKDTPFALVVQAELETDSGEIMPVFVKRYRSRNLFKAICDYFRQDRAKKAARNAQALDACGIPTARPFWAAGPRRIRGQLVSRETYLVLEWLPNTENLHLWLNRLMKQNTPLSERLHRVRACAKQLGQILGRMHNSGVSHHDLKAANILIREPEPFDKTQVGSPDLWVIDMDGVRVSHRRRISHRRRVLDLRRIAYSAVAYPWITDSIRIVFLKAYATQFKPYEIDIYRLWYDISKVVLRNLKKKNYRRESIYY